MREQNERLVLSLVRRHGPLAKSEIARMTGLSAQTVSVIMRQLEADRLLRRGEPQRGRVGQPSVPLSLDPEGAFFLGAKVGRRSLDFVLVDFVGGIRRRAGASYPFPTPRDTVRRIRAEVAACEALLGDRPGASPGSGSRCPSSSGAGPRRSARRRRSWRPGASADIRAELAAALPYPVYVQNDATAACGAELAFGNHPGLLDFVYFYVGAFVGGGLVLNGGLFTGRTGNAAALGSMPVPDGARRLGAADRRGLAGAARAAAARRRAAARRALRSGRRLAGLRRRSRRLAGRRRRAASPMPIAAAAAIIDFEAAVIDGAFPRRCTRRLLAARRGRARAARPLRHRPPRLLPGSIGPVARALGGASLPLFDRYLVDQHAPIGLRSPGEAE